MTEVQSPYHVHQLTPNPPRVRIVATEHRCERVRAEGDRRWFCNAPATFAQRLVSYERFLCADCVRVLHHGVSGNDGIVELES